MVLVTDVPCPTLLREMQGVSLHPSWRHPKAAGPWLASDYPLPMTPNEEVPDDIVASRMGRVKRIASIRSALDTLPSPADMPTLYTSHLSSRITRRLSANAFSSRQSSLFRLVHSLRFNRLQYLDNYAHRNFVASSVKRLDEHLVERPHMLSV